MKESLLPAGVKVLLVEDRPAFRDHILGVLREVPDAVICDHADSVLDGLCKIESNVPDVIIVHPSGSESAAEPALIRDLRHRGCKVPVLILTAHEEFYRADQSLCQGAKGCITERECSSGEMKAALGKILGGEVYLSPRLTRSYLRGISSPQTDPRISKLVLLTPRELEIFRLMGMGLNIRQIAGALHLSESGVISHRFRIRRKLDISNNAELYHHAAHWEGLGKGMPTVEC